MAKKNDKLTVAQMITKAMQDHSVTPQEVADDLGYESAHIVMMFMQGAAKVPLRNAGPLARAVGIDPAYFLRVVLCAYMPDTWKLLDQAARDSQRGSSDCEQFELRRFRSDLRGLKREREKRVHPTSISMSK